MAHNWKEINLILEELDLPPQNKQKKKTASTVFGNCRNLPRRAAVILSMPKSTLFTRHLSVARFGVFD